MFACQTGTLCQCRTTARLTSVGRPPVCRAGGCGFNPRPDHLQETGKIMLAVIYYSKWVRDVEPGDVVCPSLWEGALMFPAETGFTLLRRRLFPFRKRQLPFLTVDAAIRKQAFSLYGCKIFPGLSYNMGNNTFLNSLRKNEVEAQVLTLKM